MDRAVIRAKDIAGKRSRDRGFDELRSCRLLPLRPHDDIDPAVAEARNASLLRRRDGSDGQQEPVGLHAAARDLDSSGEQKRDEHPGAYAGAQCADRREQAELDPAHPDARSTNRTSNDARPAGVISNVIAQCPTMTNAGADFSYVPGATSSNA